CPLVEVEISLLSGSTEKSSLHTGTFFRKARFQPSPHPYCIQLEKPHVSYCPRCRSPALPSAIRTSRHRLTDFRRRLCRGGARSADRRHLDLSQGRQRPRFSL